MAKKASARKRSGVTKARGKRRGGGAGGLRVREFCRGLAGTTEDVKWGNDLMFSIGGKMYAGFEVESTDAVGFKCDDDDFDRLTRIEGIIPAPYAARFGWVRVTRGGVLSGAELKVLIRKSYEMVREKLARRVRDGLPPAG